MSTHRTGTLASGDVTLFYRHFGRPGATPILILHGANYYDSVDWIDAATALSADREVAVWDNRGFGESTWSPSKDYSYDAILGDMNALLQHFGWPKAVVMGHSAGGGYAILFASRFPAKTAGLILVDHCPGRPGSGVAGVGNKAKVYPTIDAALADTSREKSAAPGSPARARIDKLFKPADGGFVFKRDPDYGNRVPTTAGWKSKFEITDMWRELASVQAPALILRGLKSDRYNAETVGRVKRDFPRIEMLDLDCGHDVAAGAPRAMIEGVKRFAGSRIDAEKVAAK